jgi:hypothetical protein
MAFGPDGSLANEQHQSRFEANVVNFMDLVEASKHYPRIKARLDRVPRRGA